MVVWVTFNRLGKSSKYEHIATISRLRCLWYHRSSRRYVDMVERTAMMMLMIRLDDASDDVVAVISGFTGIDRPEI